MQHFTSKEKRKYLFGFPVIVAALGYFVDIYNLKIDDVCSDNIHIKTKRF